MKASWFVIIAFASACGAGRTTYARFPGAATTFDRAGSDPKALEIADQVAAATGGRDKWEKVKQIRWHVAIKDNDKVVIEGDQAWDRWNGRHWGRIHQEAGDIVVVREIYSEVPGAVMIEKGTNMIKQPDEDANTRKVLTAAADRWNFDTAALCAAFLLEEPGTKLTYVGPMQGDDGKPLDAIKLEFDPKDSTRKGSVFQIEVNHDTHMIERFELVKPDGNVGYKVTGWVDINGLKFPTLESNIGYAGETIAFKDIKVSDPEDSLYSRIH